MSAELAALAADPDRVAEVAPDAVPALVGELEALKARLWVRLQAPQPMVKTAEGSNGKTPDKLLTAEEVAGRLGLFDRNGKPDRRKAYRRADSWPFTVRVGGGTLRFSERGLERWQARR
jgi:hypothetical protein